MNHECKVVYKNPAWWSSKYCRFAEEVYDICYGTDEMILKIYFHYDSEMGDSDEWTETKVNYCPFCGLKSISTVDTPI